MKWEDSYSERWDQPVHSHEVLSSFPVTILSSSNELACSWAVIQKKFRISDLSKNLIEFIFNLCGELRWSPEGPVSQIHSLHLHVGAPGIFSDLLTLCCLMVLTSTKKLYNLFNNIKVYIYLEKSCDFPSRFTYRMSETLHIIQKTCITVSTSI